MTNEGWLLPAIFGGSIAINALYRFLVWTDLLFPTIFGTIVMAVWSFAVWLFGWPDALHWFGFLIAYFGWFLFKGWAWRSLMRKNDREIAINAALEQAYETGQIARPPTPKPVRKKEYGGDANFPYVLAEITDGHVYSVSHLCTYTMEEGYQQFLAIVAKSGQRIVKFEAMPDRMRASVRVEGDHAQYYERYDGLARYVLMPHQDLYPTAGRFVGPAFEDWEPVNG